MDLVFGLPRRCSGAPRSLARHLRMFKCAVTKISGFPSICPWPTFYAIHQPLMPQMICRGQQTLYNRSLLLLLLVSAPILLSLAHFHEFRTVRVAHKFVAFPFSSASAGSWNVVNKSHWPTAKCQRECTHGHASVP